MDLLRMHCSISNKAEEPGSWGEGGITHFGLFASTPQISKRVNSKHSNWGHDFPSLYVLYSVFICRA